MGIIDIDIDIEGFSKIKRHRRSDSVDEKARKKINERLKEFVHSFVKCFEEKLTSYNQEIKLGARAQREFRISNRLSGGILGSATAVITIIPVVGGIISSIPGASAVAGGAGSSFLNTFSRKDHRNKAKKISEAAISFRDDKIGLRKVLIEVGTCIFQKFENQFVKVSFGTGWERALQKLAKDATDRTMDYIYSCKEKNLNTEFSFDLITKGVILGKSKGFFKRGHTLTDEL